MSEDDEIKSEQDMSDAYMLKYFWQEKGDVERWTGFEDWVSRNPEKAEELKNLILQWKWAKQNINRFIEAL